MKNIDILNIGKVEKTPEGYIKVTAVATTTGIFPYLQPNGTILRQYRPAEAVADPAAMESLKLRPVTLGHPPVWIKPDNIKKFQVGTTGETVEFDPTNGTLICTFIVTDKEAIDAIEAGVRQLSLGYDLKLTREPGTANGKQYDAVVSDIEYNHLALVKKARAGSIASIQMDGADEIMIQTESGAENKTETKTNKHGEKNMDEVIINGVRHEVDKAVAKEISLVKGQNDELEAKLKKAVEAKESLKGQLDAKDVELDKMKKEKNIDTADAEKKLGEMVALIASVSKAINTDSADLVGKTEKELKVLVIKNTDTDFELKDEHSDAYITGRYDAAVAQLDNAKNTDSQAGSFKPAEGTHDSKNIDEYDVDAARLRQIERLEKGEQ